MASYEDAISDLLAASHRIHPERIAPLLAEHLPRLGMEHVALYLADLEQRVLVPVPGDGPADRDPLSIDGTLGGRAFRTETMLDGADGADGADVADVAGTRVRLWVPLIDGAERIGVMAVTVENPDERLRRRARNAASIAAAMIVGKQPFGDQLVLIRRRQPMELAAEMRWDSLWS